MTRALILMLLLPVTLHWTAPGDDGDVGSATLYDLRYSTDPITSDNWQSAVQVETEPVPSIAGTTEECTVDGLTLSTEYYFAIKSVDNGGNWSGLSNVVSGSPCDTAMIGADLNCDGMVDISDLVNIIDYMFPQEGTP